MRHLGSSARRTAGVPVAVAVALVIALVVAGVLVGTTRSDVTPSEQARTVAAPVSVVPVDTTCADLLVVGIDGGGEKPRSGHRFGPTVDSFVSALSSAAASRDRTVSVRRVALTGTSARRLVSRPTSTRPARSQVSAARARSWAAPVAQAARQAMTVVGAAASSCPEQQVVLVGYAQGAAAVHRTTLLVAGRPGLSTRLLGAALVSDPARRTRSSATRLGAPAAPKKGQGVLALLAGRKNPVADTPRRTALSRAWSICTRGDLVCDVSVAPVRRALRTATSYRRGKGARAVAAAATALADLATLRPAPRPETQVVSARTGQQVSLQLVASVAPRLNGTVAWRAATSLPAGLSLSPGGLLSGAPQSAGVSTVAYLVRGTSPPTPEVTGLLTFSVVDPTASVAAGGRGSCETRVGGTAWCWGGNQWGQIGDGSVETRAVPTQVGTDQDWASVDTSGATTCAVRTTGTLWCWGLNEDGQAGAGQGGQTTTPVQVGTATTWASVSTGWFHTCGLRTTGALWCWGRNGDGQLGTGARGDSTRPVQIGSGKDWTSVAAGGWYTCGVRAGAAWCWGRNGFGQLGSPAGADVLAPTQVAGTSGLTTISTGWAHTCALGSDGSARCWGLDDRGQLGDGAAPGNLVGTSTPKRVVGTQTWTSISVGDAATCGVDGTGRGWCWGDGRYGQLGNGSTLTSALPVPSGPGTDLVDVETGWFHGCAFLRSGSARCWGSNELGQVGDGTTTDTSTPKEIS